MGKSNLQLAKIVGIADKDSWSQVHTFSPQDEEKIRIRGQLLAAIGLKGIDPGIEAVATGREIISRIHEEYYGDLTANPLDQLEKAVGRVAAEVADGTEIEIAAAAVVGEVLYIAIVGQGQLVLQRKGRVAVIAKGEGNLPAERTGLPARLPVGKASRQGKIETASGYLKNDDLFALGTAGFFTVVPGGVLQGALTQNSAQEAAETLTLAVHGRSDGATVAALIAQVKIIKEEKELEEIEVGEETVAPAPVGKAGAVDLPKKKKSAEWKQQIEKIRNLFQRRFQLGVGRFSLWWAKKFKRPVFVAEEKAALKARKKGKLSSRTILTIGFILLLILGMSVIFGARQRTRREKEGQSISLLVEAERKLDEAESLISLNPAQAQQLILEAQELINELQEKGTTGKEFEEVKERLEALLPQVLREHQVEGKVFFDLELVKVGAKGDDWTFSEGKLFILDRAQNSVYSLEIADKKSTIMAGGEELSNSLAISAALAKIYVLTEKGIVVIDSQTKEQTLAVETDENWGKVVDFQAYAGNLYLLNQAGEIWKLPGTEQGFGTHQKWLKQETDLEGGVAIAIDGWVWILTNEGGVFKFIRGLRDPFGLAGLDKPFSYPEAIATDADQEKIYILDKGNLRVVALAKSGEYDSQYRWEGIREASGLVASEKEGKILLLSGSKIYGIDLK